MGCGSMMQMPAGVEQRGLRDCAISMRPGSGAMLAVEPAMARTTRSTVDVNFNRLMIHSTFCHVAPERMIAGNTSGRQSSASVAQLLGPTMPSGTRS